jgi:hypothetical protein
MLAVVRDLTLTKNVTYKMILRQELY